jgi:hypothetical protein
MLLAASSEDKVAVLTSNEKVGTYLNAGGIFADNPNEITIEEFSKYKIEAIEGKVYFEGEILKAGEEEILTDFPISGNVK